MDYTLDPEDHQCLAVMTHLQVGGVYKKFFLQDIVIYW